jgi:hypothetical protein
MLLLCAGAGPASAQIAQAKFTLRLTLVLHGLAEGPRIQEIRVTTKDLIRALREVVKKGKIELVVRRDLQADPPLDLIGGQTLFLVNGEPAEGDGDAIVPLTVDLPGFDSRAESQQVDGFGFPFMRQTRGLSAFTFSGLLADDGSPIEATFVGLSSNSSRIDTISGAFLFTSQSEEVFGGMQFTEQTQEGPVQTPLGVLQGTMSAGPEKIVEP